MMNTKPGEAAEDRPPNWSLKPQKPLLQQAYDFVGAPLRMVMLPDQICEKMHLTSLRAERFAMTLKHMKGRTCDIGAGDNMLIKIYKEMYPHDKDVQASVGTDVIDWGGDCVIMEDSTKLPFEDNSFDTVCFIACINHIPEREETLKEAYRILKPGGQLMISMIGRFIGVVGHAIWWYSEDKHREVDEEEEMGMDPKEIFELLEKSGFEKPEIKKFVYRLNYLYISKPKK